MRLGVWRSPLGLFETNTLGETSKDVVRVVSRRGRRGFI